MECEWEAGECERGSFYLSGVKVIARKAGQVSVVKAVKVRRGK